MLFMFQCYAAVASMCCYDRYNHRETVQHGVDIALIFHGSRVRLRRCEPREMNLHAVNLFQYGGYLLHIHLVEGYHAVVPYRIDRKSTRLNSSHANISYAVFCLKKKKKLEYSGRKISRNISR